MSGASRTRANGSCSRRAANRWYGTSSQVMSGITILQPGRRTMNDGRQVRIAAVGDLHFDANRGISLRNMFASIEENADILVLCGDITTHGKPEQMQAFVEELAGVDIPIVAVLGNHDYEAGTHEELTTILKKRGVHVLDGDYIVIDGVGFVGT